MAESSTKCIFLYNFTKGLKKSVSGRSWSLVPKTNTDITVHTSIELELSQVLSKQQVHPSFPHPIHMILIIVIKFWIKYFYQIN